MAILTNAQVVQLKSLVASAAAGDQTQVGVWAPVYAALAADVTVNSVDPNTGNSVSFPAAGIDPAAWLWFTGAQFVNANSGAFAHLIRGYTAAQHQLRYGNAPSQGIVNQASNEIAQAFFADVLAEGRIDANGNLISFPVIADIGTFDAGRTAARVFGGDIAPWAGTFLFV